jgi:hypothetical protein
VFTQKKNVLRVWFLPVGLLFAVSAWTQITPSDDVYALTSSGSTNGGTSGGLDLQTVPQDPQGPTGTNGTEFIYRNAFDPSCAVNDVAVRDKVTNQDFMSGVIKKELTKVVADPNSADDNVPSTLTVRT